jgi:hypothetical protein
MTDRRPCHSDITSSVRTQHPCAGTLRNACCSVNSIGYRESEYRESTFHTLYAGLRVIRLADAARSSSTDARRSAVSDAAARGWALMRSGRARGGTARWLPPTMTRAAESGVSGTGNARTGPAGNALRSAAEMARRIGAVGDAGQTSAAARLGPGSEAIPACGCRQRQGGQVVIRRPVLDHRTPDQSAGSSTLRMGLSSVRVRRGGATA